MYRRPRHNKIASVLEAFDPDLLERCEAFFGGGTAITLSLGEYRESVDATFMCASREGFAELRARSFDGGLPALLKSGRSLREARDPRRDTHSIRSCLDVGGTAVKMEIVNEARIDLAGTRNDRFGVPTLSHSDMYAEKLLANADRGDDPASGHRDMIDLGMMIARWGPIPEAALKKADSAYRGRASKALELQSRVLRSDDRLARCARDMDISTEATTAIMEALGGPVGPERQIRRDPPLEDRR